MKKKYLFTLFICAISFFVLIGCSSKSKSASSGGEGDGKEQVTLDYWASWNPGSVEEEKTLAKIKKFEEEHPNIKINVELLTFDMMHDKLIASISAGNPPDISWGLSEWFGELNRMGALLDLTPYYNEWSDKGKLNQNVMDSLTVDGKVKALPQYLGIRALLYHEDMLKEAGYDAPPETWDELLEMGPKIKEATGKEAFGITGTTVRSSQELLMYLAQSDVSIAQKMDDGNFKNTWADNPEEMKRATETFQFYKDLLNEGAIPEDSKTWGWQELDTNFAIGKYAMNVDGSWMKDREAENPDEMADVKIAPPPYNTKPATFLEVSPLYVYGATEHPKEAWEFASYILSEEWQSDIRPTNSPRTDVVSDSQWGEGFTSLTDTGVVFPEVPLGGITQAMQDSIARLLLKGEDPQDVAEWLSKAINEDLKKNGILSE
ncbi:sugar ABC transporter substrate-binding protein [Halobacillus salinarum]|uniref:Sugar ABC transporter substrate-binding protein n=1 Tax=Halobacillus salinarum TaxID=2932257 RepID=A0ABY4EJ10_9BACI|nr:sugar ABC transporter substrate-binding protein [Halobacillus salinarum]UOQ44053.1 sugar ABC transporter substrate-binding protein [Halobacillus salinarum]